MAKDFRKSLDIPEKEIEESKPVETPRKSTVPMKRNPEQWPAPHTADVHVDEVKNWAKYGWELA